MRPAREETFGPGVRILCFNSEADAIRSVSDS
jgi:acyl-CoA reductase-like NAD-dependent aldehyde dehydrogenase